MDEYEYMSLLKPMFVKAGTGREHPWRRLGSVRSMRSLLHKLRLDHQKTTWPLCRQTLVDENLFTVAIVLSIALPDNVYMVCIASGLGK